MIDHKICFRTKIKVENFLPVIILIFTIIFLFYTRVNAQQERPALRLQTETSLALLSNSMIFNENSLTSYAEYPDTTFPGNNTSASDTLPFPEETQPKLLPDRMSFMERFLWGENGFFRKTGIAPTLTPESRESELKTRRTMLTVHLIGGITTEALMLASCYYGQKIIDTGSRSARSTHQTLVTLTILGYGLTGLLAILSPPPLIRREEESTISIHKTLAWLHFAGMVVTPILGNAIGGRRHFNIDKAHVHQITAYSTTAVFTGAMLVLLF